MSERMRVVQGDITTLDVDGIVNAANNSLMGGGGVDGAIHRTAGPDLLEACRILAGCDTGDAKVTEGYRLKARWVIHTVGPIWHGGDDDEDELLASCYRRSLEHAVEKQMTSLAFPSISTGAYRFPVERAAAIAIREVMAFLKRAESPEVVYHVCFGDQDFRVYQQALSQALGQN